MALTESTMVNLGSKAPYFNLPNIDGKDLSIEDFTNEVLVVIFTCNHCPYVTGSDEVTRMTVEKFNNKQFKFIAINSNSKNTYEEDSFDNMVKSLIKASI